MNKILLILLSIIGLFFFTSCETELTVDKDNLEAPCFFYTVEVTLDVNKEWTASSSAKWCQISPSSGDKTVKTIRISIENNDGYSDRECQVTINSKEKTETISVKQAQKDALIVETSTINISDKAQSFSVNVSSNINYIAIAENSWIKDINTKALSSNNLKFYAEANDSMEPRDGSIRLKQRDGLLESVILIKQNQKDSIILSCTSLELNWENAFEVIDVVSNIDYYITIPDNCTWLQAEKTGEGKDSQVHVSADDFIPLPDDGWNPSVPYRTGTIILSFEDISKEIIVTQLYRDYIWISQERLDLYPNNRTKLVAVPFLHNGINQTLIWESNNEEVATVDNGIIAAHAKGVAIITVSNSDNSFSASCIVTVKNVIDDIRIKACGKNIHQYNGYFTVVFHSRIYIPSAAKSVVYNSVWLCQPNGTVADIKGTQNGYVEFKTLYLNQNSFNDRDLDSLSMWFVIYQIEVDGVFYEFKQNIDAHTWTSNI